MNIDNKTCSYCKKAKAIAFMLVGRKEVYYCKECGIRHNLIKIKSSGNIQGLKTSPNTLRAIKNNQLEAHNNGLQQQNKDLQRELNVLRSQNTVYDNVLADLINHINCEFENEKIQKIWEITKLAQTRLSKELADTLDSNVIFPDGDPMHEYFGLSYATHLVIPRCFIQSMPTSWQRLLRICLENMDKTLGEAPERGGFEYYSVQARKDGKMYKDPWLQYERGRRVIKPLKDEVNE